MLEVEIVNAQVVDDYLSAIEEVTNLPWEQSVIDRDNTRLTLKNGKYGRERKAYGLYYYGEMIGYAVVHIPHQHLDIVHVQKEHRGKGFAKWFLSQLEIKSVSVDTRNERGIHLYSKLGYDLEFYEDEFYAAC